MYDPTEEDVMECLGQGVDIMSNGRSEWIGWRLAGEEDVRR